MSQQRAVIDIGSNTVRLVIFDGPPRAPVVLLNEKVTARLGRAVAETGKMSAKSMATALAALARYAAILKLRRITDVVTLATAAPRDAENGPAFLDRVRALGLSPRLLSGEEEAVTSATGVLAAFPGASGIVADLGGGSLELVDVADGRCDHGTSMPLGTLRLPPLRAAGPARFARQVHALLGAAHWSGEPGQTLYLVGGSFRAFAHFAMQSLHWPLDDSHGFELDPHAALTVCRAIGRSKLLLDIPGVSSARRAALPDTAALLSVLLRELAPSRLVFSAWGLREGALYRQLPQAAQKLDPLLAGIAAFTEPMGVPQRTAAAFTRWIAAAAPGEYRLRFAAVMLSLAAQGVEPNLRGEEGLGWALRKRWIALDPADRAVIAAAVLANTGGSNRKGPPPPALTELASPAALHQAQLWGLAIRLCRRLTLAVPSVLENSALVVEGGELVLAIRQPYSVLATEANAKDLRALAERLGLQPRLQIIADDAPLGPAGQVI